MYVDISMIGGLQVNASNVVFVNEIETGVVRTAMNVWINEKRDFGLINIEYTGCLQISLRSRNLKITKLIQYQRRIRD